MKLKTALFGTVLSLAAFTPAHATVIPLDSITINIADQTYNASSTVESKEFLTITTGKLPTDFTFKPGVVFLTEPGATSTSDDKDGLPKNLSDILIITKVPIITTDDLLYKDSSSLAYKLVAAFVSDGEKGLPGFGDFSFGDDCWFCKNSATFVEAGSPQDVSAVFGLTPGSIFIQSDLDSGTGTGGGPTGAPELSTWMMMLLGFAGIASLAYRRARKNAAA